MSTEYVWNGLRVRRSEQGKWLYRSEHVDTVWLPLSIETGVAPTLHAPIIAELDKLYPRPRTVTLDNGETWERNETGWSWLWGQDHHMHGSLGARALDRIWKLENGDDR